MAAPTRLNTETIKQRLTAHRYRAAEIPSINASGVYALFLLEVDALPSIATGKSSVLYVGMTESSLEIRNHFTHEHSGFSTLRRSLGALLRHELGLQAIPRGKGPSRTNITNYRFPDDGEQRLTRWIQDHVAYAFATVGHKIRDIERDMIAALEPPLNLTALGKWRNPHAATIRRARAVCRDEALQVQMRGRGLP